MAEKLYCSVQTVSNWERDLSEPDLNVIKLISKLFDISLYNILSDSNDDNLDDDILEISLSLLNINIIPNIRNLSEHSKYSFKLIKNRFFNDRNIVLFIISNFDNIVKDRIIFNLKVNDELVSFFIYDCLPILTEYKSILAPLYRDDYTRHIVKRYLIDVYSDLLFNHFNIKSLFKSRLIAINIIELINASLTHSGLTHSDIISLAEDIKIFI